MTSIYVVRQSSELGETEAHTGYSEWSTKFNLPEEKMWSNELTYQLERCHSIFPHQSQHVFSSSVCVLEKKSNNTLKNPSN